MFGVDHVEEAGNVEEKEGAGMSSEVCGLNVVDEGGDSVNGVVVGA